MKVFKRIALLILVLFAVQASQQLYAQTNSNISKSKKRFQLEVNRRDSIIAAIKERKKQDSLARVIQKQKIIQYRDSLRLARIERRKQDSIAREAIKAQILAERKKRDSIRAEQQAEMKRLVIERKRVADSIRFVRKAKTDSMAKARLEARKAREALKKYKNSRGYRDSVSLVRKARKDSIREVRDERLAKIKAERTRVLDSTKEARQAQIAAIKAERKRVMDSTKAARTAYNDSVKSVRQKNIETLKLARQKRKDSLEKVRGTEKLVKNKKKTETELLKEQADKIHARKKGSWTNEKLLKKGWNIKRRIWQNTVTRYNSYYNAIRKYDDALKRFKDRYKETYTEQIALYPYNLESGLSAIGGDMDTVVKKCAYDTQIHDPRSKWFDNLYLLMGKAFYFKNDYESAITAFQYVVNEYKDGDKQKKQKRGYQKLPALNEIEVDKKNKIKLATLEKRGGLKIMAHHPIRNQALVWLARAYTKNKQYSEAQSLLNILEEDKQFPDRLRDELYLALAELNFEQGNNFSAVKPLESALKQDGLNKTMKNRVSYLLAQLYAAEGNLAKSNKFFNGALKNKLPIEMEYFTKLNLAQNAILGKGDKTQAIEQLESLARNDKFDRWRPQTFLSLGQILQTDLPEKSISYFEKCLQEEKNKDLQAAAFLGKGQVYYKMKKYRLAKTAYDSTIVFAKNARPTLKNMDQIKLRKEVLGSLVTHTTTIETEDSLQSLSKMSKAEQIIVAKKELRRQQKERRKQLKAESAKLTGATLTPGKFGKNSWYFYNNTSVQQGLIEFKTKWGDRQLVDNWRRSGSKSLGGGALVDTAAEGGQDGNDAASLSRNAEIQKLLAGLYKSPKDFAASDKKIQDAYFQLALIYSSRLQEYQTSIETLELMNHRFDQHDHLGASYYSMILSHKKLKEPVKATNYINKLKKEFPNSQFAKLVDGSSAQQDKTLAIISQQYDTAYAMLQRAAYTEALSNVTASLSKFSENILKPKFELVKAKSLAGLKRYDSSMVVTENIIKSYPESPEQKYAQDFLRYLIKAVQLKPGVQAAIGNDSLSNEPGTKKKDPTAVYTYDKDEQHYYILYLTKIDGSTIALKAGFSDYNRIKHSAKKLKTNMNLINRNSGILSIVEFRNADFADRYAKQARNEKNLFSQVNGSDFKALTISKSNFKELLKTRKIGEYLKFYKKYY